MKEDPLLVSPEEFILTFPEFSKNEREQINLYLRQSQRECPGKPWNALKEKRGDAIKYLTAHRLAMNFYQIGNLAGSSIEAAKGGNPALPKGGLAQINSDLTSTHYGQEFLRIKNTLPLLGILG